MTFNKTTVGYIVLIAMLIFTSAVSIQLFFRERSDRDMLDVRKFPMVIGDLKGTDVTITEAEYKMLETRNIISRHYTGPDGATIYLFIIYSETNRSVFHPPEVCMVGSGMELTDKKIEQVEFDGRKFSANKLYAEKGEYKSISLYAYKTGSLYTDSYYLQQAHFAFNRLLGKNRGGATIRVTAQIVGSEAETVTRLKAFMAEAIRILEKLPSAVN